ncbi:MAG: hypothetical protein A2Y10_06700 [Planctomycetes bacterium GWF2_41_51]|nr:MAG: hypothetical protein A2Y10_06700 [Planctomycetes bacterium GWF2_41_51]HBG28156.1 hypothetical protein [Phycisphaerales bacterium]
MWTLKKPEPVKLIIGILAANETALNAAIDMIKDKFGECDLESETWAFTQTEYYAKETGSEILKKFITVKKLITPDKLAAIKLKTNKMEEKLARMPGIGFSRPVNLDPGYIEPSKLVLASTKNFSHRIYIGKKIWAEVTLVYNKGRWVFFEYTFPDHREERYHGFFSKVREKLVEQIRQ